MNAGNWLEWLVIAAIFAGAGWIVVSYLQGVE
jgi:hypothetical protein